ncbi:MAG: general secretion pathway protein N [Phenylobacterium sp.]|jgi:general secretion pathway protein N
MKNWKLNIGILIAFYLLFLLSNIPAAMVLNKLTMPAGVKLSPASGSLWSGNMALVQYKNDQFTNVNWQLSPLSLLVGSLSANVSFGKIRDANSISGTGDVSTNFSMDAFSASDFTLRYPAADLVNKIGWQLPTKVGGKVAVKLNDFTSAKPYCEVLDGTVVWNQATLQGFKGEIKLGKLDAELSCKDGAVVIKVTKKNPLGLQVTSILAANNKFSVDGFVQPNGEMPDEVHQAMKFLGQPDKQGRFTLKF